MDDPNPPLSADAIAFIEKIFPCEPSCDSFAICEACMEASIFIAGYNFGYRAGK